MTNAKTSAKMKGLRGLTVLAALALGAFFPSVPASAQTAVDLTQNSTVRAAGTYTYFARGDADGTTVTPFQTMFYPGPDLHLGSGNNPDRDGTLNDTGSNAAPVSFGTGELTDGNATSGNFVGGWINVEEVTSGSPTATHGGAIDILFDLGASYTITSVVVTYTDLAGRRWTTTTDAQQVFTSLAMPTADGDLTLFATSTAVGDATQSQMTFDGADVSARYVVVRPDIQITPNPNSGAGGGRINEVQIYGVIPEPSTEKPPQPSAVAPIRDDRVGAQLHLRKWEAKDGISHERILKLVSEAGMAWVRDDFYWNAIEKEVGQYAMPPEYQKVIDAIHSAGLKHIAIFNAGNPKNPGNGLYAPDNFNPDAYARAAAWFAGATRGKVQVIEILNEPNNFGFRQHYGGNWNGYYSKTGKVDAWVGKYVELLNKAAEAIKKVNPDVKVIGLGSNAPVGMRQIAMGISPAVDGMTAHPYSYSLCPEYIPFAAGEAILQRDGIATADEEGTFSSQIRMFFEQCAKFNGPREIWLTEWGWSTYQQNKTKGMFAGFTRSAQAKYILRRLTESMALGVKVGIIYDLKDDGTNPHDAENNFGLVDYNLNPKPAYHAVKNFTSLMSGFRPADIKVKVSPVFTRSESQPIIWDGSKIQATGSVRAYAFDNEQGELLIAIWSAERADGDRTPIVGDVEIYPGREIKAIEFHDLMATAPQPAGPLRNALIREGRVSIENFSILDYPAILILK